MSADSKKGQTWISLAGGIGILAWQFSPGGGAANVLHLPWSNSQRTPAQTQVSGPTVASPDPRSSSASDDAVPPWKFMIGMQGCINQTPAFGFTDYDSLVMYKTAAAPGKPRSDLLYLVNSLQLDGVLVRVPISSQATVVDVRENPVFGSQVELRQTGQRLWIDGTLALPSGSQLDGCAAW